MLFVISSPLPFPNLSQVSSLFPYPFSPPSNRHVRLRHDRIHTVRLWHDDVLVTRLWHNHVLTRTRSWHGRGESAASWWDRGKSMTSRWGAASSWHDLATYSPRGRGHGTIWPHPHREDATMGDLAMSLPPRCSHVVITTRLQCLTWYRPEDAIVPQSSREDVAWHVVAMSCYDLSCRYL